MGVIYEWRVYFKAMARDVLMTASLALLAPLSGAAVFTCTFVGGPRNAGAGAILIVPIIRPTGIESPVTSVTNIK